jgi:diaminopimelate epimerase
MIETRDQGAGARTRMEFTKAVATGNDFVIMMGRKNNWAEIAKKICDRKRGVGADGLLVIDESKKADIKMRIFNPDGSEAQMCGNGSRCAALYAATKKLAGNKMTIETLAGVLDAEVRKDMVKVKLTEPKDIKWNLCLTINKCPYKLNFVNTGVPHVVHFVEDLDKVDVKNIGSHIRNHDEFSPDGTNADFVQVLGNNSIALRTYERGVEDETLACGTGAVASAIISAEAEKMHSPVIVETRGGEKLKVHFTMAGPEFKDVYLEGSAKLVFDGIMEI